jgi:hypothetical protein
MRMSVYVYVSEDEWQACMHTCTLALYLEALY